MRFNFVSETGDGMGIAYQVLQEGNEVRFWSRDPDSKQIGDGLVPKVGDLEDLVYDAEPFTDVFIFDTSGNGVIADGLRHRGFGTLGAGVIQDRAEKDRQYAMGCMKDAGINIPKTVSFKSFDDGIKFVQKTKDRLVYKPSKRLGEMSPSLVTYDQADALELLQNLRETVKIGLPEFDLQFFTVGLEISSEAYFVGGRFVEGLFNHTFERKQLLNGNLGPSGGCTGNIVWACDGQCPVCKQSLRKLEPWLRETDFHGMIDINGIIGEDKKFYGLEFTPRFGYDASPTLLYGLLQGEVSKFLSDAARGQAHGAALREETYAAAVKVTIPPWPSEKFLAEDGVPVRGLEEKDYDDVYWYNVKAGERASPIVSAGAWGIICLCLGSGNTVRSAFGRPYRLAEKLRLPDKQYRTDLVEQFKENFDELETLFG